MVKFVTIKHPVTGVEVRQPESTARVLRARGWLDPDTKSARRERKAAAETPRVDEVPAPSDVDTTGT